MLTFKLTCPVLCGLSIIAPPSSIHHNLRVIHCLAPLSLSSAAVVSPGLWRCWMVAAPPLLAGSSGVQRRSSWTSIVTSPQAYLLGLDLSVSCFAPLCAWSLQTHVCLFVQCYSLCADWQAYIYFLFCLFLFVKCPWVPWKALYKLNVLLLWAITLLIFKMSVTEFLCLIKVMDKCNLESLCLFSHENKYSLFL